MSLANVSASDTRVANTPNGRLCSKCQRLADLPSSRTSFPLRRLRLWSQNWSMARRKGPAFLLFSVSFATFCSSLSSDSNARRHVMMPNQSHAKVPVVLVLRRRPRSHLPNTRTRTASLRTTGLIIHSVVPNDAGLRWRINDLPSTGSLMPHSWNISTRTLSTRSAADGESRPNFLTNRVLSTVLNWSSTTCPPTP